MRLESGLAKCSATAVAAASCPPSARTEGNWSTSRTINKGGGVMIGVRTDSKSPAV
jgi:hypothetical protein